MNIKITIITPCFNSAKTLKQTIDSVLSQKYKNVEYIIIDGASEDTSLDIIRAYEKDFKENGFTYKWISEPDEGISDAFNKGVNLASGDLIGILNSDDWFEPDALKTIIKYYNDKHSIYCGNLRIYNINSHYLKTRKSRPFLLLVGMYINHPTVFVKREVYLKNKFNTDLKIAMDYEFLLKARKEGFKIMQIDKVISNMRQGGISWDMEKMRAEEKSVMKNNLPLHLYVIARIKLHIEEFVIKFLRN